MTSSSLSRVADALVATQSSAHLAWRLATFICVLLMLEVSVARAEQRPNIIYIMSDDMGYSDIGCYGSEISTPNLNRLAEGGVRFTQFYNTARCCPTRASLLTGLYPHQAGIGHMISDSGYDGYRGELNRQCVTLAEVLGSAGYRTYMSGKWHVTAAVHPKTDQEKFNWPLQRGFDRFYGTIHGAGSFYDPKSLTRDNTPITPANDREYQPEDGFYYTDAITDNAVRYIREHGGESDESPFFLYVSYTAAHWPMHAREKDIAKYKGKYDAGYEAIRRARYARMCELGVIDAKATELWPMDASWKETEYLNWDIRNMEVYAAMIDSMDQGIGKILAALEEADAIDNTLILFFQDNGGCAENYGRGNVGKPRLDSPSLPSLSADHLQLDMQPKQTRDGYPVRTGKGVMAGPADTYIGYGRGWATVSNTPFREYKHWVHEGGISTPLIVHWPAQVTRKGELESTPGHLIDLMATAVDVAKAEYPAVYKGEDIYPMEGKSLLPAFQGKTIQRRALYWEHEGNRAVRSGDWKLVAKGPEGPWELYNIASDRSEQRNLAKSHPEKVAELTDMFQAYAERAQVLPLTPYRKKKQSFNRAQKRFELEQGANLSQNSGPYIANRGIRFAADIEAVGDGVLVAQGGTAYGWAVYIKDSAVHFVMTNGGKRILVSGERIGGGGRVEVQLMKGKRVTIRFEGNLLADQRVASLITQQPVDGLQVGSDTGGNVGEYEAPFAYPGTIANATVELIK